MRLIIFGVGKIFEEYIDELVKTDEVVALVDNALSAQGKMHKGIRVVDPEIIIDISFDYVLIMCSQVESVTNQLLELGVCSEKIVHGPEYIYRHKSIEKIGHNEVDATRRIAVITSSLGYHGGAMATIFFAMACKALGFHVDIITDHADSEFMTEFGKQGYSLFLRKGIRYARWEGVSWLADYKRVVVNTYLMIRLATELSEHCRTFLWLHESDNAYFSMQLWREVITKEVQQSHLTICAVSKVARKNFYKHVCFRDIEIMPYGIPDCRKRHIWNRKANKMIFAVIGSVFPLKQQMLFVNAIKKMNPLLRERCEFWIVGEIEDSKYGNLLLESISVEKDIEYLGKKNRRDLEELREYIDVVVVTSQKECLPIVATEAFRDEMVCILCDEAGTMEYLNEDMMVMVYPTNDVWALKKRMELCVEDAEQFEIQRKLSRKVYESVFSIEAFSKRIQKCIL